jgi:hypothetical protein
LIDNNTNNDAMGVLPPPMAFLFERNWWCIEI